LFPFYCPIEDAADQLRSRCVVSSLRTESALERHLSARPYAVLFRQVATPNYELHRFVDLASAAGLTPLVLEFHQDKFVTRNAIKYSLGRMGFHAGTGKKGGPRIRFLSVADLPAADGRQLCHAVTRWGQGLVSFHHELLSSRPVLRGVELFDGSDWFLSHNGGAGEYYADFLSLFVRHAVLFESFLYSPQERQFTTEVVIPAFAAASARHGCRPLVCRLDPADSEGLPYWLQYPDELHDCVAARFSDA
jgi:hypothetical protein